MMGGEMSNPPMFVMVVEDKGRVVGASDSEAVR
jgi:hypothetical protein